MYFVNAPFFLRWCYPRVTFNKSRQKKEVYLTFDDGPIPDVTPFVLDTLAKYAIKATFFCVGENVEKHSTIYQRILQEGHRVGNHTYNHLKGWDTDDQQYLANVSKCQALTQTNLFRPPYARAKKSQLQKLYTNFEVVFWDVLSGDFDTNLSPEKCYRNVIKHTRNGSILVFHDNLKAVERLAYALPRAIEHLLAKGYTFATL